MKFTAFAVISLLAANRVAAQIPTQEDFESSKREPFQEGLDMREVRESSAKDVGEALAKLEGLSKVRKGAIANDVVLRGLQGGNLNVLVDGARIYGACPADMDPIAFHVDFAEVERIEVTKGVFDIANQGSLGGSVNIIRKRVDSGIRITPSLQTGSFGYFNPSIAASAGNERVHFSGGFSHRRSAPFRDGNGNRMTEVGGYRAEHRGDDAFQASTGWGSIRFSPAAGHSGEIAYTRQDAAGILYPYLQMDAPYDIADRVSASYEMSGLSQIAPKVRFQGYYTGVVHWMTDEKRISSLTARDVFGMATFAHTRAAGGSAGVELRGGLTAGFELFQRNWDAVNSFRTQTMVADQHIVPNVNATVAGAHIDWRRSLGDRWRLAAGARLDTSHTYARDAAVNTNLFEAYHGASELSRRNTSPSGNARLSFELKDGVEIYGGAGSTARFADAQELYLNHRRMGSDWVGNPGLSPSRNTEITAGANLGWRRLRVRTAVFSSRLADFIVVHNQLRLEPRPGVMNTVARSYANVDARIHGGEMSYSLDLGSRWTIFGGASYSRGTKTTSAALRILDNSLPEMPPLRGRTSIRYGRRRWFTEAEAVAVHAQRNTDTDLFEQPTAGYAIANWKIGIHWSGFNLTAGIDNVFHRHYFEHLSFQRDPFRSGARVAEPGRSLFLNVSNVF